MSQHVPPDLALIVAALDQHDPERRAAWEHAAACEPCRRVLEQGEAVLELIDAQAPHEFIDPALKQRILNSVEKLPPRRKPVLWQPFAIAIAALVSIAFAFLDGEHAGLHASQGWKCIFWEVMFALAPLAITAQVAISMRKPNASWILAFAGVAGGLVGQLYLRARCPLHDVNPHLLVFHCAGVLTAAAVGLVIARGIRWVR